MTKHCEVKHYKKKNSKGNCQNTIKDSLAYIILTTGY